MRMSRRLFVVLLANNDHGKSSLVKSLLSQGLGQSSHKPQKGRRALVSPWGRQIDAFVFVRSFQETEKAEHETIVVALDANDPHWRERELILFPSHVNGDSENHTQQMIEAAHAAGFDVIAASLILGNDRKDYAKIWGQNWDKRWTLPNPETEDWQGQIDALGRDLWTWICRALASQESDS
jgi:hypothetical protein